MGRNRYRFIEKDAPHFLTCTVVNWSPIFTRPATVQIVLDSFRFLQRERDMKLYGYVILENHLHWIAQAKDLPRAVSSFKSFTAKSLVRYFEDNNVKVILDQFSVFKKAHKGDRNHQVWQEGSHPQLIQGDEMMRQKLEYIHRNPVKRGYVDAAEDWRYSSARNYAGREALIEVETDWN